MFDGFLNESLIKRALASKKFSIKVHNLRDWTTDKHHTVDDRPYGGGPGMILKIEPIHKALKAVVKSAWRKKGQVLIIMMDPAGEQFNQKMVPVLASKYKQVVILCGRYEGFDARVRELVDERISVGPYVLSGGELPAMVIMEAVSRFIPGVLGHEDATVEESHSTEGYKEYPQYTRPEVFKVGRKKLEVPNVLLSGDHGKIREWRKKQ